jgi:hypothetical protein
MTKGKVVLVRFPFDDLSATKVPSLIRRELGTLSAATQEEIAPKLRKLFAL